MRTRMRILVVDDSPHLLDEIEAFFVHYNQQKV